MKEDKRLIKLNNRLKSFIFLFGCISILLVTMGYSVQSGTFAVNGEGIVRSMADVRITNAVVSNTSNSGRVNGNSTYAVSDFSSDIQLKNIFASVSFDITVTNLSSYNVLITNVSNKEYSNNLIKYDFTNMEVNKTVIPAASEYTFTVTFTFTNDTITRLLGATVETLLEFLNGTSSNLKSTLEFTFHKMAQYTYEINAVPDDALIVLKSGDNIIETGTSHVSRIVDEGTVIEWSVTHDDFYTQSGTDTVNESITHDIVLERKGYYYFTVDPTPSDSVVTIKVGDEVVATGIGKQMVNIKDLTEVTYTVDRLEYASTSGSFTLAGEDHVESVTLEELSWITGTFVNTDRKVATTKEDTVYHPGYYLIEMWGGKGGQYLRVESKNAGYRGEAGYIYAVVNLEYNDKIYFTLGGNGRDGDLSGTSRGGENGGGYGGATYSGGGGGYSAFAVGTTTIDEDNINAGKVLMIVAGGGGAGGSSLVSGQPGDGGNGGTMTSTSTTISIGTVFHGADGTLNGAKEGRNGLGGTTTSTTNSNAGKVGGLLLGGEGSGNGGGGGAGYYGGSGSGGAGTLSSNQPGGAGGGSSFIAASAIFSNLPSAVTGKLVATNPSETGGAIVITYLGKTYE